MTMAQSDRSCFLDMARCVGYWCVRKTRARTARLRRGVAWPWHSPAESVFRTWPFTPATDVSG